MDAGPDIGHDIGPPGCGSDLPVVRIDDFASRGAGDGRDLKNVSTKEQHETESDRLSRHFPKSRRSDVPMVVDFVVIVQHHGGCQQRQDHQLPRAKDAKEVMNPQVDSAGE